MMGVTQPDMVAQYRESRWRKMLAENKLDMGLIDANESVGLDGALLQAVLSNKSMEVRELARRGANPNQIIENSVTLLARACVQAIKGQVTLETIIALLQSGADPLFAGKTGATPRQLLADEATPAAARLRTVLQLWEKRVNIGFAAPANDDRPVVITEDDSSKEVLRS